MVNGKSIFTLVTLWLAHQSELWGNVCVPDCSPVQSCSPWWRHKIETFSALLALCERNPPVTGGFPSQRPVTRSFGVFFDLRLYKRLGKQSRRRWFGTPSLPLWRHPNAVLAICNIVLFNLALKYRFCNWEPVVRNMAVICRIRITGRISLPGVQNQSKVEDTNYEQTKAWFCSIFVHWVALDYKARMTCHWIHVEHLWIFTLAPM